MHGIGIIGFGAIGRAMAMAEHPEFQVVGTYDPRPGPT
jgi:phosphoglycerate dehydrogenase-like enzyme